MEGRCEVKREGRLTERRENGEIWEQEDRRKTFREERNERREYGKDRLAEKRAEDRGEGNDREDDVWGPRERCEGRMRTWGSDTRGRRMKICLGRGRQEKRTGVTR